MRLPPQRVMIVNEASSFAHELSVLLQLVTETKVKDSKPPLHGESEE